jgi:predicted amino acid dehydrogenase
MMVFAALLAAAIGALPTGYLVARRMRGLDIRRLSPHNLGLGAVVAAVGAPILALVVALDLLKGALGIIAARALDASPWSLAAAAAGVILGHAYSPVWRVLRSTAGRMKGAVVGLGAVATLVAFGNIAAGALTVPMLVTAATLVAPRIIGRSWGYLSLATVLAAMSLPLALWATGAPTAFLSLGAAYALVTLWNYKEHLGRIADGVEPRIGDRLPLPWLNGGDAVAAFLIHPMTIRDVSEANRFRWLAPLQRRGIIPDRAVRWLARFMRPMKVDQLRGITTPAGRKAHLYLIGVPLLPDQIRGEPALAVRRAVEAAHLAANLGATVLGLGAYWSVVGNKGEDVAAQSPIAITNGGAYTAGTVKMAVPLVLARLRARGVDPSRAVAAVVGANGVVGFGICRAVVEHVGRLIMIGTSLERLERSRELLQRRYRNIAIDVSVDLNTLREADAIFTATSEPAPVIFPQHVRGGAVIFDLGRPYDVDASVVARDDVEVIPGGVVRLPGDPRGQLDMGYGPGLVPACLAETVVLALDGCYDRASIGDRTKTENIDFFVTRATALGFEVQTTGRRVDAPHPAGAPTPVGV